MKIALYHNLPSGGGLYHFSQVAQALAEAGHELHLFTPSTAETDFSDLKKWVSAHKVFPRETWKVVHPILNPFSYRFYLEKCMSEERVWAENIEKGDFDRIYLGQCRIWTEPPLLRFLPKALPKILYCQEPKRSFFEARFLLQMSQWPWWKKFWRRPTVNWMKSQMHFNISCADRVLCNSEFSNERIRRAYPGVFPVTSYIGVDVDRFCPDPTVPIENQIISVGALDPSKNHGFAIDVAASKPAGQTLSVVVVTDRSYGDTADQLRSKALFLGVELKIFTRVSTEELVHLYRSSLATVYTPIEEPFGIVSIESQACGTPVLGVNEGGLLETVVDGIGGYLLTRSVDHFRDKLAFWLGHPESRLKYAQSARQYVLSNWQKNDHLDRTLKMVFGVQESAPDKD